MNRTSRILASGLLACSLGAGPASAASDYLLKLEGVPGESAKAPRASKERHKDWIEILSYSWGANGTRAPDVDGNGASDALTDGLLLVRYAVPPGPAASGSGKVKLNEFTIKKATDTASPSGVRVAAGDVTGAPACTVGQRYGGAQFRIGGKLYQLSDVVVADCMPDAISLRYGKVTVKGWNPERKE